MQPKYELTLHPVDLSRYGRNPYGEPVYRVVWANTRKSKVSCHGKVYIMPRYEHGDEGEARGKWILEKWAPASVLIGMDREQYEAFLAAFPGAAYEEYPERGDWELSRVFNEDSGPFARNIDEIALHKQLAFHEWRARNMNLQDHVDEIEKQEAVKELAADESFDNKYEAAREANSWQN